MLFECSPHLVSFRIAQQNLPLPEGEVVEKYSIVPNPKIYRYGDHCGRAIFVDDSLAPELDSKLLSTSGL